MRPLAIDLFCGLGGWTEGLLTAGWDVIGFDIERHVYGEYRYPAQLVLQDVLTLHGSQFRSANLIVASPPCQEYSYMAMPWKRAKAKAAEIRADATGVELSRLNRLFNACFRLQREACQAAGRHIPMVVENVRGAQPWVGRARWSYGSYFLWGDVPALMPRSGADGIKVAGLDWKPPRDPRHRQGQGFNTTAERRISPGKFTRFTSRDCGADRNRWFNDGPRSPDSISSSSSSSPRRKQAEAMIAKIPSVLSEYIADVFFPRSA